MKTVLSLIALAGTLVVTQPAKADSIEATLYKNPQCGCCEGYADYLRENGFTVVVMPTHDLSRISSDAGVPTEFQGCHTMFVGDYVVDGHVPVHIVRRLLEEHPSIAGVTLPGMPAGSPGMSGIKVAPFVIYSFGADGGQPEIYAVE